MIVWLARGLVTQQLWVAFICWAISTYLMILMNNQHALIRIYSRMVSCIFMLLSITASFLMPISDSWVAAMEYAAFYIILFHAYQDKNAAGLVFYAFLCLGMVSLVTIKILWLLPLFWILLATKILAMSTRTFTASIIGVATPYWFALCYYLYSHGLQAMAARLSSIADWGPVAGFGTLPAAVTMTIGFTITIGVIGSAHFLHTNFKDKIRTRMIYEFLIITQLVLTVAILLQPHLYRTLLPLLFVNTAPLAAHFAALSRTRASNVFFLVLIFLFIAITVYNLVVC